MRGFLWILWLCFGMMLSSGNANAEEKLYHADGKRDPFVQLVAVGAKQSVASGMLGVETLEEIAIEGIVIDRDPKASIVVANGSVMKEGDEAGNVRVIKIKKDGVIFSVNGIEGLKPLYDEESGKV